MIYSEEIKQTRMKGKMRETYKLSTPSLHLLILDIYVERAKAPFIEIFFFFLIAHRHGHGHGHSHSHRHRTLANNACIVINTAYK